MIAKSFRNIEVTKGILLNKLDLDPQLLEEVGDLGVHSDLERITASTTHRKPQNGAVLSALTHPINYIDVKITNYVSEYSYPYGDLATRSGS